MNLTRLNALALGWAINLIVIFKYGYIAEGYALISLCCAYVADMIATIVGDFKLRVHPVVFFVPALSCILFGAIGILKVIIHVM